MLFPSLLVLLVLFDLAVAHPRTTSKMRCFGPQCPPSLTKYTITFGDLKQRFLSADKEVFFNHNYSLPDSTVLTKIGYHGTKYSASKSIAREGLRSSMIGMYGARIYTTPSLTSAMYYAMRANSRWPGDPKTKTDSICHLFMPLETVLEMPYISMQHGQPGCSGVSFTSQNETMVIKADKRISQINYSDEYADLIFPLCEPLPPYKTSTNQDWKTIQIFLKIYTGIPVFAYRMVRRFKRHSVVHDMKTFPFVKFFQCPRSGRKDVSLKGEEEDQVCYLQTYNMN